MQNTNIENCQQKLINIRSEVLNTSIFKTMTESSERGDEADQAASEINLNLSLQLRERDRLLIQKVDHALSKIKDGSFGECEACGAIIEEKRLVAQPYTTLCIACKEEQEHSRRFFA